ncbi:hypothetical protein NDU88_004926 [Pleurodeles waltl]|uniref:Uncharacterized protein n=1 Tax=Pleurodeles waltl TaxID=8319 RepID=A0AAV7WAB9_PLEWA|nr:hypothetical protein NDU88_004926 [Pleurodeles waltl]
MVHPSSYTDKFCPLTIFQSHYEDVNLNLPHPQTHKLALKPHKPGQRARWCRRSGEARKAPPTGTKHRAAAASPVSEERRVAAARISLVRRTQPLPFWIRIAPAPSPENAGTRGRLALRTIRGSDRRNRRGQHLALSRLNRVWSKDFELSRVMLRSVIERTISEVLIAVAGVTRFIRLLSYAVKTNMAPKTIRNLGDKSGGAKTTRIGKDKGEAAGANKRLTSITGKAAGSNVSGSLRDAKTGDSNTPPSETRPTGKKLSTITAFLASGVQNSLPAHTTPPLENKLSGVATPLPCAGIEAEDSNKEISEKIPGLSGPRQPQRQQFDQNEELELQNKEGAMKASGPALERDDLTIPLGNGKQWDKVVGKDPQLMDWGKDCSDKFYSLTEESDLSSVGHSFSESEGSETSEADNKSPSNELPVRQYRQRKMVRIRPGSQEGVENAASVSGRTLKWDYSGIGLIDIPTSGSQGLDNEKTEIGASAGSPGNASTMGTEAGILQSIYNSIKELQTETRIESQRARIATKRLQGTVRKVVKSCTEIEAKLCSMEERIVAVEEDVDTLKEQNAERDGKLTDVEEELATTLSSTRCYAGNLAFMFIKAFYFVQGSLHR